MIEIIPVLDLMSGVAVSGKSGRRETYQPLKTVYSLSSDPVQIVSSLKRQGVKRIYIADLDAIEGVGSNLDVVRRINHIMPVMLDWGVKDLQTFQFALDYADKVILATETLTSIRDLEKITKRFTPERIVFSIDIKDGQILSKHLSLGFNELKQVLEDFKLEEIILLDISGVGTLKSFNSDLLDRFIEFGDSLILGGGVTPEDLHLHKRGINKFLIGSALHSGKINLDILNQY
jgi:phosphoribosylformimino-5-aminoimidazole carboxamide ribotide isomerase